jgi:hypothetical protein
MMIKVIKLKRLSGYRLHATFSDGMAGEHDFSAIVGESGPMVEPLRDPVFFARVFLENGSPTGRTVSMSRPAGCAERSRRPARWRGTRRRRRREERVLRIRIGMNTELVGRIEQKA